MTFDTSRPAAGSIPLVRPVQSAVEWRDENGDARFAVYTGASMNPTLQEPEVVEVLPYCGRAVQVGDVVLFLPPGEEQPIVHRVVQVTAEGMRTRGDNNPQIDSWLLQPADIAGQIVSAWRGTQHRMIRGGWAGRLLDRWLRFRRVLNRTVSRCLRPLYHALARHAIVARLLPKRYRPRVIAFQVDGRDQWRLLLGNQIVGWYDLALNRWIIRRPFRLFVDEATLGKIKL